MALERAVGIVLRHRERGKELSKLLKARGWEEAAKIAAYDLQHRALDLAPWQKPPCAAQPDEPGPAGHLLRRLLRHGISRWHPDPLKAIAAAGSRARLHLHAKILAFKTRKVAVTAEHPGLPPAA
jgi:hypothetical protein